MPRFILRFTGKGLKTAADVAKLVTETNSRIVGDSPRMLFVEGPEEAIRAAVEQLEHWTMTPENFDIKLPEPHSRFGGHPPKPKR